MPGNESTTKAAGGAAGESETKSKEAYGGKEGSIKTQAVSKSTGEYASMAGA